MAELRYSQRALRSLEAQVAYLDGQNPVTAGSLLTDIFRACDLILEFPQLGRSIPGTSLRFHLTRKYRFRLIYRAQGDVVEIRDIMHPRQNWPKG